MPGPEDAGLGPHETYASGLTRFLVELVAWIAGPWAAATLTGSGWFAIPAALVLVVLPAVFSTPGDKHQVVVATPGPVRVVIELALSAAATAGAWIAWPPWAGALTTALVVASISTGWKRMRWLLDGAPARG